MEFNFQNKFRSFKLLTSRPVVTPDLQSINQSSNQPISSTSDIMSNNSLPNTSLPYNMAANAQVPISQAPPYHNNPPTMPPQMNPGSMPGATPFMHQSPTPEPGPASYIFAQTAASVPPSIAQTNTAQLADFMSAFLAAQGTPQSTASSATSPSTVQQPSPTSPSASTPHLSPLQPQQLLGSQHVQPTPHLPTHQSHKQPAPASEPPVMRI